jgi:hypothetical protein
MHDDEKGSLNCATLVGNENTYRDTLSSPRAANAIGQDLHTLRPTNMTILKRSNENPPGSAIRIPPSVIKGYTSAHNTQNLLECSLMARIRQDTTRLLNEGKQPLMGIEMSDAHPLSETKLSCHTTDASPTVQREVSPSTTRQPQQRKAVSKGEEISTCEYAPIAKVALALPIHSLTPSMRAIPSHPQGDEARTPLMEVPKQILAVPIQAKPSHPSNDEFKSASSVVYGREGLKDVISLRKESNIDAYRTVASDIPVSINPCPATTDSLSQGDAVRSQPPKEAATTTQ